MQRHKKYHDNEDGALTVRAAGETKGSDVVVDEDVKTWPALYWWLQQLDTTNDPWPPYLMSFLESVTEHDLNYEAAKVTDLKDWCCDDEKTMAQTANHLDVEPMN